MYHAHRSTIRLLGGLILGIQLAVAAAAQDVRIEHVTVISPERSAPLTDASVLIHDGRIVSLAAHDKTPALTLNGKGLYLTPGLIDSHVHLGEIPGMTAEQETAHPDIAKAAREQIPLSYLLHGFTTLVDLVDWAGGIKAWNAHTLKPDTYFCGPAPIMDGYPMVFVPKPLRYQVFSYMLIEPGTPAPEGLDPREHTPAAVVSRMKADGMICAKTFFERGFDGRHDLLVPKAQTIRELVQAAHAAGLPVLMHANSTEAQAFAVETGVDIIAHGLWNWSEPAPDSQITGKNQKILDDVLSANMGWQPTIQVLYGETALFSTTFLADPLLKQVLPANLITWYATPEGQWFHDVLAHGIDAAKAGDAKAVEAAVNRDWGVNIVQVEHATAYLAARNGRLLFGTDTPSAPTYANPPGLNGWLEMQRLVHAGVTPAQIFQAATLANARALKLDRDVGTVAVGKKANLLLLRADPTQSIQAYATIEKVILGGQVLDPANLRADRPH
jgi:imidazolonepropionase-like amidohydrolase